MLDKPLVSINIPTHNSERSFVKCLEAIQAQTYPNFEIIVVDGYSKDATPKIARSYEASIFYAKGLLAQRRLGIEKSEGEFILLLDSDQILTPDALEECLAKCRRDNQDALIIPEKTIMERENWIAKLTSWNMEVVQGDDGVVTGTALPRFFRSNILKPINLPETDVGYYDHAFIYREVAKRGARVGYAKTTISHFERNTLWGLIRKFYRFYGLSFIPAFRYDKTLVLGRSLPTKAYFSKKATKNPLRFCGLLFLYSIKLAAGLSGIMVYFIKNLCWQGRDK